MRQVWAGVTLQQAAILLHKFPRTFQALMLGEWSRNRRVIQYAHLDELADRIYEEDRVSGDILFSSEVAALQAVVVVLSKLDKYLDFFSYKILNYSLVEEIKQIPQEEVA
jgi:hypothetical protein